MPNGKIMVATHTALIILPQLPLTTWKCDIFPSLQQPLLSIGQFCRALLMDTVDSEPVWLTKDIIATLLGTIYHKNSRF